MRPSSRLSCALPLAVSLLLHAGLLGGMVAMSNSSAATSFEGIDTRTTAGPSGLILQMVPSESDDNTSTTLSRPGAHEESTRSDFDVKVIDPPIRNDASTQLVLAPVVAPPPSAGTVTPMKPGTGGTATGGRTSAGGGVMFAAAPTAKSVVYVLDRSGSMGQQGAYRMACAEVVANLSRWPSSTQFQVVLYNSHAEPLCINASLGLLPISADTVQKAEAVLAALPPTGWTDHLSGLRRALMLAPDVLYLVTDADDLKPEDVRTITNQTQSRTVIHTIEMCSRYSTNRTGALAQLAANNHGTHRRVPLND
jgi:hypothetical protein